MLPYRILRAAKNRYGSTNELGMFDMTGQGLAEIENPSQMLLEGRPLGVSGNCVACTMEGSRPILSEIQALATKTNFPAPRRACSGYDYNRMNLLIAVLEKRAGYFFGNLDVYVNIVGGIALRDTACDLSVCLSMVSSLLDRPVSDKLIAIGEVGLGGDMTAAAEAAEWLEAHEQGKKMTTSCCPAFVNMIRKHYPELADNISTTISPMCAVSRMLKAKDPGTVTVFVGPCIAKKSEVKDNDIEGNADYVLTIGEFRAMMRAKDVQFEPEENDSQQASVYGKRFGNGGGVTAAVLKSMEETGTDTSGLTVEKCAGAAEVKKALTLMKVGRLQADFVEGMMCEGGCVGGPSQHRSEMQFKKDRDTLIAEADDRGVHENLESVDMEAFAMHR